MPSADPPWALMPWLMGWRCCRVLLGSRSARSPRAMGQVRQAWVEGTRLAPGDRVVFVEDVSSTGASLLRAIDRVLELGVVAVAAVTLLDRSPVGGRSFPGEGV